MRVQLFVLFAIFIAIVIQRSKIQSLPTIHTPAPVPFPQLQPVTLSPNTSIHPYYKTGPISNITLPSVSSLESIIRKKIDNFIFNHYNLYHFEFTFTDLGYSSNFIFNFFTNGTQSLYIMEKIGFNLHQNMLNGMLNLDIYKKNFQLTVRQFNNYQTQQTITSFWLEFTRQLSTVSANFTHIIRNNQCFTSIRSTNIISHKCFGGLGYGKLSMQRILLQKGQKFRKTSIYNSSLNLTRTVYDGFRASGMKWNWVWGVMSGFSKIQYYQLNHSIPTSHWLGLNFGHIDGEGEDFAFIDGKIIPIQGLQYLFNDKIKLKQNITVTSNHPKFLANLQITSIDHNNQDLGVLKLDLLKVQGNWDGWIQKDDGKIYRFYQIAGFFQRCHSIF